MEKLFFLPTNLKNFEKFTWNMNIFFLGLMLEYKLDELAHASQDELTTGPIVPKSYRL